MKAIILLPLFLLGTMTAEEATLIAPIIREPIAEKPPAPLLKLDIAPESIIDSKTVTADGQKITLQEIEPITLPPLPEPPPPPPLTEEQLAHRAALASKVPLHRTLLLSCTVHDGTYTVMRGITRENDEPRPWEAWSNINFRHFQSLPRFQKNGITYTLLLHIVEENSAKTAARYARLGKTYTLPTIPKLPADPTTAPQFIVTKGTPTAQDLAPIEALHELYQDHHQDLISEYQRIKAIQEREAADRLANPPNPKLDIVIQHWTVTPDAPPASTKLEIIPTKTEGGATK